MAADGIQGVTERVRVQVEAILAAELGPRFARSRIVDHAPLDARGLGLSSLETMAVILEVEETFAIFFEDDEIPPSVRSLGSLLAAIGAKLLLKVPG
jgi:acyl carrier protein